MALPTYATPIQRTYYYAYLFFCGVVFFFLIAPLIAIVPISFSVSPFMVFTEGMLAWPPDPEAWSFRWYRNMIGDCSADVVSSTVPCSNKWMIGTVNSFFIGIVATVIATALGTLAALGLSRPHMPFKGLIMAILISPMIVPLIITAAGMFFFYARINLVYTFTGVILAHVALATPFVVITVTATLVGFDMNMVKAAQSLGARPVKTFFLIIKILDFDKKGLFFKESLTKINFQIAKQLFKNLTLNTVLKQLPSSKSWNSLSRYCYLLSSFRV